MQPINILFTLSSLNVLLVTVERFSFTTSVVLQPFSYLRLHELVQMTTLILFSVIIPLLLLKQLSHNFESLRTRNGQMYLLLFVIGVYFYATGNGLHEVASFLFNHYCDVKHFKDPLCGSLYFNNYYTGNILFFIGGYCMNLALALFERMKPVVHFNNKDLAILIINSLIYAFAIFAYAAFDRVLVGIAFAVLTMITIGFLLPSTRKDYRTLPFTLYCVLSYTAATVAALLVRFVIL